MESVWCCEAVKIVFSCGNAILHRLCEDGLKQSPKECVDICAEYFRQSNQFANFNVHAVCFQFGIGTFRHGDVHQIQFYEDGQLYDIWVREFCRQAPNKELRLWLEGQAEEIYKEQGLEPFGLKERS